MCRVLTGLLTVCFLTAFAPAPFPRSPRRGGGEEINLQSFQGTWRAVKLEGIEQNGGKREIPWGIAAVRVQDDLWTFLNKGDTENAKYRLDIDGTKKPSTIDFYSDGTPRRNQGGKPSMVGIMRRQGDTVHILYYSTGAEKRPQNFDNPPVGWWLLTLERRK
jgi:uncharacterized protein (TIGR03067 family)